MDPHVDNIFQSLLLKLLLLNASLRIRPLTLIIETFDVLVLPGSPSVASTALSYSLRWLAFMTRSVTKATPIQFVDRMKESYKTALSGYCA